jgi:hypothetical protein
MQQTSNPSNIKEHSYSRLSHLDVIMAHITIMFSFGKHHIYFTLKNGWNRKFYLMNMSWIKILCRIWLINMNDVYWCNVICKPYYVVIIKAIHNVKPAMYTLLRFALVLSYKNYHSWTRGICYFHCVKDKGLANQKLMVDKGILQIWRGPSLRECHFTKLFGNLFFCLFSIWKFNASSYFNFS